VLDANDISTEDKITTYTEHLAFQIAKQTNGAKKLLATGGGAFNSFLIKRIESYTACEIIVPSKEIIAYKEALVMALIGVLRIEHKINTYSSVTGALKDSIGGAVYLP
jgi:anhydro-N-acetylmuramic acid kinase